MSWFRTSLLFLALLSATATMLPAQAELSLSQGNTPNSKVKVRGDRMEKLMRELQLSNDQIQRIKKIRQDSQSKMKERRFALKTAKQELKTLMNNSSATNEQLRQKRREVQGLHQQVADLNFENTLAIRNVLTPEQRVKLQRFMQQRRQNNWNKINDKMMLN
jgi:Spy/CpxP family protein refolding chaperone